MLRKNHLITLLFTVVLTISLISCASTPKQKQLLTVETFNDIYKQYLDEYDRQTPEVQAEWKADIDPLFKEASDAIKIYGKMVDPTSPEAKEKVMIYQQAKSTALKLLLKYGVEIKEE